MEHEYSSKFLSNVVSIFPGRGRDQFSKKKIERHDTYSVVYTPANDLLNHANIS